MSYAGGCSNRRAGRRVEREAVVRDLGVERDIRERTSVRVRLVRWYCEDGSLLNREPVVSIEPDRLVLEEPSRIRSVLRCHRELVRGVPRDSCISIIPEMIAFCGFRDVRTISRE